MENSRSRRGSLTPSSIPRTLWSSSESPTKDLRSSDDQKTVNVQVVLRCRPLNEDEIRARTPLLITCDENERRVTAAQNTANKQVDKTFVFDKVFGPSSQQKDLYDDVVSPVISEVLEGYSWTIFAYGQTGTGKTYTMEGEGGKQKKGEFDKDVGVIPRAVQQIFDKLESEQADYSMRVTFLELYNEEITDLLASNEGLNFLDEKTKRPLVLMDDGKGAVFVRGLEEEIVSSADEIYTILEKGSPKKHTAETLLNKQSNRSHSIFTIAIQIKESSFDGTELVRCGKLSLVDLAGSENILRSGAREARAREAGEINKSLLTLGRVINALAENSSHVPYRHSKLTRLLRDSLGGKTKTCIIATVSPSILSQEETLSTLDYAFRAKSIKNRPEVNQKLMKCTVIKDLHTQIDRLKQELHETRRKSGSYAEHNQEATNKRLMELQELYLYQQQLTADLNDKLEITERELTETRRSFSSLEDRYRKAKEMYKDKETMIFNVVSSGKELTKKALELRSDLEGAASDVSSLFARIEHKNYLEETNRQNIRSFYSQLVQQLEELNKAVADSATNQEQNWKVIQDNARSFLASKASAMNELSKKIENLKDTYASGVQKLDGSAEELYQNSQLSLSRLSSELSSHTSSIMDLLKKSSSDADSTNNGLKTDLNNLGSRINAFIKQQQENHVRTYQTTRSISDSLLNFFKSLRIYISKLTLMEEDSQSITKQNLSTFMNKFEAFSLDEEKLLLEEIARLLANSSSRKKKMIQAVVDDLQESACKRTEDLHQEHSDMQNLTADAEENWNAFIDKSEKNNAEDSAAIEAEKNTFEQGLQSCITKSTEVSEQQSMSEESLFHVLKKGVDSVDSLVKNEIEAGEEIHTRFSSVASSLLAETVEAIKNVTVFVENPMRLDNEASDETNVLSARCLDYTKQTSSIHSDKVAEISRIARKSLLDDYLVDSSGLSPWKRNFSLPSDEDIEGLIHSSFGDLLDSNHIDKIAT
ncbi:hypothetical protein ACS0TY_016196 [Phlomoides rotata]